MVRLIPKDEKFYDLFIADGENLARRRAQARGRWSPSTTGSTSGSRDPGARAARATRSTTELAVRLERAFITPFDREDIHELAVRLDDVVDGIQEIAETFLIYGVKQPTEDARQLAGILSAQAVELLEALKKIEEAQGPGAAPQDRSTSWRTRRTACRARPSPRLFRGGHEALEVIKWRDLYTSLEETIDAAEDAGEVIERILTKI